MNLGPNSLDAVRLQQLLLKHADELGKVIHGRIPQSLRTYISPEDILQETWTAAFRSIDSFHDNQPNAFIRWISTIATNKVIDAIKKSTRTKRGGRALLQKDDEFFASFSTLWGQVFAPDKTPSRQAAGKEAASALAIALSSLPNLRRQVVYLRHIEGLTPPQIAAQLQMSVPAVNSLHYHGLRQLRELLGDGSKYISGIPGASEVGEPPPAMEHR